MGNLHKAALVRAYRSFLQAFLALIPAGFSVNFVTGVDWSVIGLTLLGMIATAAITGCISFIQAVIGGLPEVMDDDYSIDELEKWENENGLEEE